jgi:MFS family permease
MTITVAAFQALGVSTALPDVARDLGGLDAYGWAFSAYLLASIVGMVAAGQAADARGPARAFLLATLVFGAGCLLAAAAQSWAVLIGARSLQGLGNGAVLALVYVAVARAYPPLLYGRMMALLSSAWVVPSLVGPGLGAIVAEHAGWRWVFLMFVPLLPLSTALALGGLRTLEHPDRRAVDSRVLPAIALAAGLGALLAALEAPSVPVAVALAAAGAALAGPAFRRLLPAGTLRLRRGLPASLAMRALLAVGYLGADAFLPLALTRNHGLSLTQAGLVVSAGALSWSVGAIVQGRADRADAGAGRARRATIGAAILTAGVIVTTAGVLTDGIGPVLATAGWVVSGYGIGVAYPSIGALALAQSPPGDEGRVSGSLQVIESIAVGAFTGTAGAVLALGLEHGWPSGAAMGIVFAAAAAAAAVALPAGRRVAAPA